MTYHLPGEEPYLVALRDQAQAGMRTMAMWLGDIRDAFIQQGFSDEQAFIAAMTLMEHNLDHGACHGPD